MMTVLFLIVPIQHLTNPTGRLIISAANLISIILIGTTQRSAGVIGEHPLRIAHQAVAYLLGLEIFRHRLIDRHLPVQKQHLPLMLLQIKGIPLMVVKTVLPGTGT